METAIKAEAQQEIDTYMANSNFGKRLARGGVSEENFRAAARAMFAAHSSSDPWWSQILGESRHYACMRESRYVHAVYTWIKWPDFKPSAINWV